MIKKASARPTDWNSDLLTIWLARYLPKLGLIPTSLRSHFEERVAVAISIEARQLTQTKILDNLTSHCAMSGVQAQQLMMAANMPLKILEAKKISLQISAIYQYLMDAYVQDFIFSPVLDYLHSIDLAQSKQTVALKILPAFHRLMMGLEPLLDGLQTMSLESQNRRAIGFLTTQIHLSRQRILRCLDAYERIWLSPYLQLTEELLCMPWQRVCTAANQHSSNSPMAVIVTKMLPMAESIATSVYQRALRAYPNHISRQGRIQSDAVQTSSIRDLSMFQTYIWLALLEGNLSVIEYELLPLCLLVFPCSNVRWQFVQNGIKWLGEEISMHLTSQERLIFSSYIQPIQAMFRQANPEQADITEINRFLSAQLS